jgi:hypothetical protein
MIASFAQSDSGKLYRRTCDRFGIDPGAALDDDVMGYNLNLALLLADVEPQPDEFEAAKRKSQEAFS